MRWLNNLNATPRLMVSFGVLLVLTLGISVLGVYNLGQSNSRLEQLYHVDMVGTVAANEMVVAVTTIRGDDLNAVYRINDAAAVDAAEKDVEANLAALHAKLDEADKLFVTARGIEQLGIIRRALPDYERSQTELFRAIKAHDSNGMKAEIETAVQLRATIRGASDVARTIKREHAEEELAASDKAYHTARALMITVSMAALLLGVLLSLIIARGFSVPLEAAVETLEKVAAGDLTVTLQVDTKDEMGRMAGALNRAVERLGDTLTQVTESAHHVSSSSQELAAASESIAAGAQEQASSLEETSASLEEITATVRQSADNAQQASQLASGSRDSAEQGQAVVAKAITAMEEINAASAKIADIISTIDEIAFQTNLLAVNAAVEAARAGEEGRGFAVVASEVRSLAQRTAVAAKEIKLLIQDSLRKVDAGSQLVNRSGETLQGIVGSVKRVTDIVSEIAAAVSEQSTGIEQVNTAMTQMDQVTQSNSAQTEELSATAQSLSDQAAHLQETVAVFQLDRHRSLGRSSAGMAMRLAEAEPSVGTQLSAAVRPPVRTAARTAPAKSPRGNARPAKARAAAPSAPVAPAAAAASDESFEEF